MYLSIFAVHSKTTHSRQTEIWNDFAIISYIFPKISVIYYDSDLHLL